MVAGALIYRAGRALRRLLGRGPDGDVARLYAERDFLAAYSAHTDKRVAADPAEAVGGMWEEIGALQFDFLRAQGLRPADRMLDIGCGTLRGGRLFIAYLDAERYTGLDISPAALDYGRELVAREGLADKRPRLVLGEGKDLSFAELGGARFDLALAQSVFTHLPPELIADCFAHLDDVLAPGGRFYFTYHHADAFVQTGLKDFRYPLGHFQELAARHGLRLTDLSAAYAHPRGQRMVLVEREDGAAPAPAKDANAIAAAD